MRVNLTITAALLTLLVGVVTWALQPTEKAFSWIELSDSDYLFGYLPMAGVTPATAQVTVMQAPEVIAELEREVPGDYAAFAAIGRIGRSLALESGESFPLFSEQYVTEGYFRARGTRVQHGRLFRPGERGAVVIGHSLARQRFGDPASAVGARAAITGGGLREEVVIVGVLAPSPAQHPEVDADFALVGSLEAELAANPVAGAMPLTLQLSMGGAEAAALRPDLEAWVRERFGPLGGVASTNSLIDQRQQAVLDTRPRIHARRHTFLAFGAALVTAALLALYAQSYWYLLRRRQLLGVDKALGATRAQLMRRLLLAQLPWGLLGSALGCLGLWALYDLVPGLFLTRPPAPVLALAVLTPSAALLALAVAVSRPLATASAVALLRGRVEGGRIRPLLVMVYAGLALALGGGLAASRVQAHVTNEGRALDARFGLTFALQAGDPVIDTRRERAFEAGSDLRPVFSADDAQALAVLPGVTGASLAQAIPGLGVANGAEQATLMAVAADASYLPLIGLELAAGDASACLLAPAAAQRLGASLGDELTLAGLTGPVACRLSGVLAPAPELWGWLVPDLPELITPPLDGLGLPVPGHTAAPFRSTRVLLRLAAPEAEAALSAWLAGAHPDAGAEAIPYTPDVATLLTNLRAQATLFTLIAALAALLSAWGVVGGFLALLDAERFKTALDRALGLSLKRIGRHWWARTLALGAASATLGTLLGVAFTDRLYDALSLDVPDLPATARIGPTPALVLLIVVGLLALSWLLSHLGTRWVSRRSTLQLLKEGAA